MTRILGAAVGTAALVAGASVVLADHGDPSVDPDHVEAVILPGASLEVDKEVHTPEIPPSPEIYFLVDTTGSMTSVLNQVKADIGTITAAIDAATSNNAAYGFGQYKDFPFDPFAFAHQVNIGGDILPTVSGLTASGGSDGSEGQFFALDRLANTPVAGFTGGGTPIVVWIGDAPAHDPVCAAISGLGYDITEASVTADLITAGLTVVAVSTTTGFPLGLDDNPTASAGDYVGTCAIGGAPGQATAITGATGGTALFDVAPADVADAILAAIGEVEVEVSMVSDCDSETGGVITTTFDPASQTVTSGDSAFFTETISVAADAPGGVYECTDYVLIDGERMLDADGDPVVETKHILVPENFVTGGGNITNGLKGKNRVLELTHGGNAGYMPDGTLVGHWNFNFHKLGVRIQATEITALQFLNTGLDPAPPDADADTAVMEATGRANFGDGWEDGCTINVTFVDGGEPEEDAVNGVSMTCPSGGVFGAADLTGGNIQIHEGTKG